MQPKTNLHEEYQMADDSSPSLNTIASLLFALNPSASSSLGARTATNAPRQGQPVAQATAAPTTFKDFGDVPAAPTRRVVITGLGTVTPLGYDTASTWEAVVAGKTGIKKITDPKFEGIQTQIAAYIDRGTEDGQFDGTDLLGKKKAQQMAPFIQYAMVAATEAMNDANWHPSTDEDAERTGVALGSGIGGIEEITDGHEVKQKRGVKKISPRFIPKMLINLAGGFVSMEHNAKGPNTAAVTACATGAHAIGDAFRFIKHGDADVMITGGTESAVEPLSMGGFNQMRALATNRNDEPEKASRPFDEDRSGFVMGEGAGILVLEELEHARARGAKIYAEIRGVGYTGDAYHVSAPSGEGGRRAMQEALKQGGMTVEDIDYINAHGTSTPVGDQMELETIQGLFGGPDNKLEPVVTSTKGATGHMLGAAGAVEAVFTTLAVASDTIPPTLNLEKPCVTEGIKHVTGEPLKTKVDAALSNSFGFGGTNACILISKPPPSP
jgi:3-oxoacyl-[acyl-carrier-protein] synthase II